MNKDDVPEVGQIHKEAFAGYMNTRLGASYTEAFLRWFLNSKGAAALVAREPDGKIVGYVLGAPIDYGPAMNRDLLLIAGLSVVLRPWLFLSKAFWTIVAARIRSTLKAAPTNHPRLHLPEPTMGLIAIGVAPAARRKKVGVRLVQAFEVKARELGARSLLLTVYSNNSAGRKLYEGCNWVPVTPADSLSYEAVKYVRILNDEPNEKES
jgi:ribosomal protein S18 acetylase RimI-like enzyme